eukprot:3938922-Rhodomonas_salina.1
MHGRYPGSEVGRGRGVQLGLVDSALFSICLEDAAVPSFNHQQSLMLHGSGYPPLLHSPPSLSYLPPFRPCSVPVLLCAVRCALCSVLYVRASLCSVHLTCRAPPPAATAGSTRASRHAPQHPQLETRNPKTYLLLPAACN